MPQSVPTEWPRAGYQQLLETTHKAVLPKMSVEQIEAYFIQIGSGIVAAAMKKNVSTVCDKLCLQMYITGTFAGTNSRFPQGVWPLP